MRKIEYKPGQKVGTCIYVSDQPNNKFNQRQAIFRCACGKNFKTTISSVSNDYTKGCGCGLYWTSKYGIRNESKSIEYFTWARMRNRCNDPNDPGYKNYGGRGIKVCKRWSDYSLFLKDMGRRPGVGYSIERIKVNLGYSPPNCKWATRKEQNRNKRNCIFIKYKNKRMSVPDWAETLGIPYSTIKNRIERELTVDEILSPKKMDVGKKRCVIQKTINNEFVMEYPSLSKAAKVVCVTPNAIFNCVNGKSKSCAGFLWVYKK